MIKQLHFNNVSLLLRPILCLDVCFKADKASPFSLDGSVLCLTGNEEVSVSLKSVQKSVSENPQTHWPFLTPSLRTKRNNNKYTCDTTVFPVTEHKQIKYIIKTGFQIPCGDKLNPNPFRSIVCTSAAP
jgi:hypothetical protein